MEVQKRALISCACLVCYTRNIALEKVLCIDGFHSIFSLW